MGGHTRETLLLFASWLSSVPPNGSSAKNCRPLRSGAGGELLESLPPNIAGGGLMIGGIWSPGEDPSCLEEYEAMIVFQMGI